MEDLGNPFEEQSTEHLVLFSKEIADHVVVKAIINIAQRIEKEQFQAFVKECLIERSKALDDVIHCNKFNLFNTIQRSVSKNKLQVGSLKCDAELFQSYTYIGCQTREGNLEEFFTNQQCLMVVSCT